MARRKALADVVETDPETNETAGKDRVGSRNHPATTAGETYPEATSSPAPGFAYPHRA